MDNVSLPSSCWLLAPGYWPLDVAKHTLLYFYVRITFFSDIYVFNVSPLQDKFPFIFVFPVEGNLLANSLSLIPTVRTFCKNAVPVRCAFQTWI